MRAGQRERLRVRTLGIARVRDPDRRDVHRGAAVDDVADACLPRVRVPVAQLQHEPLLREEETVIEEVLAVELGHPGLLVDDRGQHQLLHVVGVEVVALDGVRVHEHARHQRVVGDVPVALPERRERALLPTRAPDRLDDALDPATVVPVDLVRFKTFGGAAESIADRATGQAVDCPAGERSVRLHGHPWIFVQPSDSCWPSWSRVILSARYERKAGVAISAFHCG